MLPMPTEHELDRGVFAVSQAKATRHILEIIRSQTGMRVVGVAWVHSQGWRACAVLDEVGMGLKAGDELDVDTTLCKDVMETGFFIAFNDACAHPKYHDHPTPKTYNFRAYSSFPILLAGGKYFGNLFALDPEPREAASERSRATFVACAGMLGKIVDDELDSQRTREDLQSAQTVGAAREEFLAVVAHDLRNPLQVMRSVSDMLIRGAAPEKVGSKLKASAERMTRLIDDLVDFTKGRAGSEISVQLESVEDLTDRLETVVEEFRLAYSDRELRAALRFDTAVLCDAARIQQLVSNLLGNALAHGAADAPVVVEGFIQGGAVTISVTNSGEVIPEAVIGRMFDAYFQGPTSRGRSMGLGLSICRQIMIAHGGDLRATSNDETGTRFFATFPVVGIDRRVHG